MGVVGQTASGANSEPMSAGRNRTTNCGTLAAATASAAALNAARRALTAASSRSSSSAYAATSRSPSAGSQRRRPLANEAPLRPARVERRPHPGQQQQERERGVLRDPRQHEQRHHEAAPRPVPAGDRQAQGGEAGEHLAEAGAPVPRQRPG